jgi:hypothetical protein
MFKVLFRIGNQDKYIWKEIEGVYLQDHAQELANNLTKHRVFNVMIPSDEYNKNGLPSTFELETQAEA